MLNSTVDRAGSYMKSKLLYLLLAAAGLGGLGWYAYQSQRNPGSIGFEVKGAAAPSGGQAPAKPGSPDAPKSGAAPAPGAGGRPSGPVNVEAAKVVTARIVEEAVAAGTLRANETVTLRSEIAGRISRIGFTDGARVGKGTVLIALDNSVNAAEVEQARAELALAQSNFERTSDLAQRNFVSQSAKDQAAANLKVQDAKLKLVEARLDKSFIRAPFNGVMGLRNLSAGDFVKDGADLAVIEDISTMKVDVRLPERYLGRIKPGMPIQLAFDSLPGKTFTARLFAVDAQIDANGRSMLARGSLPNPDGALRSGMFAKARVLLRENPQALMLPEEAVIPQGNDVFVYRVDSGKAMRTQIKVGQRSDGKVEVLSGLAEGDQVVTAGQLRLQRDGQEVKVIDPNRRPGGGQGGGQGGAAPGAGAAAAPAGGPAPAAAAAAAPATAAAPAPAASGTASAAPAPAPSR